MSEDNNRSKWLHLRLSPKEYETVQRQFSKTTCRKISEYARKRLLSKPVTVNYRNQSLDELMRELIQLRSELYSIGNNFNQAVKKLHTLNMPARLQHLKLKKLFGSSLSEREIYRQDFQVGKDENPDDIVERRTFISIEGRIEQIS